MLIYDISRDVLTTKPYDGDPKPCATILNSIENGDEYNLTKVTMSTHQATHIDAPKHFDDDGETIGNIKLSNFYGKCTVVTIDGVLTGEDMEELLPYCRKRLILHGSGNAYLTSSAAQVIAQSGIVLVGTDADSIAAPFDLMRTHLELARASIAVLENLYLEGIEDGVYTLCAFPLKLSDLEAAPCRAVLLSEGKGI
ncbi:MAG: cyclase family protein [Ruminococcaceae bacterium]|nr:cyclase family protein [Oscillospiraceae bacterium]